MCQIVDERREFGERGLAQAMDRLRENLGNGQPFDVPFADTLFWIYSLHQFHEKQLGKPKFRALNKGSDEGQTLRAIEWARTFVAHDLLQVGHLNYATSSILGRGVLGMMVLGSGPGPPIWTADDSLQSPSSAEDDRREEYRRLVAGKRLLAPLEMVQQYLASLPD